MSRPVTFVHTADLHLDAPFKGIDAEDSRVRTALVESTYVALDRIVSTAIERDVDFVLLAGDCYNARDKSLRAQMRFADAMQRLAEAGIAAYVAQGNHDPADGWSGGVALPEAVRYFSTSGVERIEVTDTRGETLCVLYGQGYATAATTGDLAAGFSRRAGDETAIGVLHTNVGGQPGYEPYAPATLDQLRAAGMDYWALGHIHKPMDLHDAPTIRYCGSPQGLNPKEDGAHGCRVVTMDRGAVVSDEFVPTASVIWARHELDIESVDDLDDVRSGLRRLCGQVRTEAAGCPAIVRIDLTGRGPVHGDLVVAERLADLVDDARAEQMGEEPWVWVDRIRDLTRPAIDIDFQRSAEDFSGDLVRITDELMSHADDAERFVADALEGIDAAFGPRERDASGLLERARDACLDRLLSEVE